MAEYKAVTAQETVCMFYSVFSTEMAPQAQWQSELLEYSRKRVGQKGVLIRLVATDDPGKLPLHRYAECIATQPWDNHSDTNHAVANNLQG